MESISYYHYSLDEKTVKDVLDYVKNSSMTDFQIRRDTEIEFEKKFGFERAILVNSGTSALELAMSCMIDIKRDIAYPEIIGPAYGHPAWILAAISNHCKPVFCDVDYITMSLDSNLVEKYINENTAGILFINKAGYVGPEIQKVFDIAKKHNLIMIEDSCNALGHKINGKMAGTTAHFGCYSFSNPKTITCGEGGMLVLNSKELTKHIYSYERDFEEFIEDVRYIGGWYNEKFNKTKSKLYCGRNYNLAPILCQIVKSQIDNINAFISEQRRVYEEYLARNVNLFSYPMDGGPSPSINIVRKMNAAKCKELLDLLKIPSHYKHYKNMSKIFGNNSAEYPVADMFENSVIMLPKSFDLSAKNLDLIAKTVNKFKDFR